MPHNSSRVPEYKRIKNTRHKRKCIGIDDKVQSHKDKLKKKTSNDNFRIIWKPGTPEGHRSMKSNFNVINKCGQKVSKKGDVDYDKQSDSVKNPYNKN